MKKYLFIMVVMAMMATPAVSTTLTKENIDLYEKDASGAVIADGAWGFMQYRPEYKTFAFWFCALGLEGNTEYTLIYFPGDDPGPGDGLICLGSDTTDSYGRIHICGTPNTGDLPKGYDTNQSAKILLVKTENVDCGNAKMIGRGPYLYGEGVAYKDTCDTLDLLDQSTNIMGTLSYVPSGTEFCFTLCASGLSRSKEYTLVHMPDPSTGPPWAVVCLGNGKTNSCGRISINACIELNQDLVDAEVWLFPSDEVDCPNNQILARPTEYLKADGTINYNDTQVP